MKKYSRGRAEHKKQHKGVLLAFHAFIFFNLVFINLF